MRILIACECSGRVRTYQGIADAMAKQWGDEKALRRHLESQRELGE